VLVVGNSEEFGKPLDTIGPVTNVDITIPPPPGSAKSSAPKPTASNPEGKALAAKVLQFLGGADKIKSIKALHYEGTSTRESPQGEISLDTETTIEFPDKLATVINAMGTQVKIVVTPAAGFRSMGGQVQDMPSSVRSDAMRTTRQQLYNLAQHIDDPKYVLAAGGTEKVGNVEAAVLTISGDGNTVQWFVNPATGELLQASSEANGAEGPSTQTMQFSGWKLVDGINFYTQRNVSENGKVVAKDTVKSWAVNPTVNPAVFEKTSQ
ncbi:MAG TPA: hypothetical protein VF135_02600, partial [Terriglobales bacterium]